MYTPAELREKVFKSGHGYDKKDVEQFLNELSSDYEQLLHENNDLKKKVKDLNDSIGYYKSIERTLQKALVLAEKTAQDTKATAIKEADAIEAEAKVKAKLLQADSINKLELLEHKTLNLLHQYDFFKIQFQNLLNAQLELLNSGSFNVNTEDFLYHEKQQDATESNMNKGQDQEQTEETVTPYIIDYQMDPSEQSYQTEDGFEFINLKDE